MKHKIIDKDEMKLIGSIFYGDPFHSIKGWSIENEIGRLWVRFIKLLDEKKEQLKEILINPSKTYEVHIDPVIAKAAAASVGVINSLIEMAQIKLLLKTIPGGKALLRGSINKTLKKR